MCIYIAAVNIVCRCFISRSHIFPPLSLPARFISALIGRRLSVRPSHPPSPLPSSSSHTPLFFFFFFNFPLRDQFSIKRFPVVAALLQSPPESPPPSFWPVHSSSSSTFLSTPHKHPTLSRTNCNQRYALILIHISVKENLLSVFIVQQN